MVSEETLSRINSKHRNSESTNSKTLKNTFNMHFYWSKRNSKKIKDKKKLAHISANVALKLLL